MIGKYPTYFISRKRGQLYQIVIRCTYHLENPLDFTTVDPAESNFLSKVITKFTRCTNTPIDYQTSKYTWGDIYYAAFPIPYEWRHPFLQWLSECFGPPGVHPDLYQEPSLPKKYPVIPKRQLKNRWNNFSNQNYHGFDKVIDDDNIIDAYVGTWGERYLINSRQI